MCDNSIPFQRQSWGASREVIPPSEDTRNVVALPSLLIFRRNAPCKLDGRAPAPASHRVVMYCAQLSQYNGYFRLIPSTTDAAYISCTAAHTIERHRFSALVLANAVRGYLSFFPRCDANSNCDRNSILRDLTMDIDSVDLLSGNDHRY